MVELKARLIVEQETTPIDELGWIIPLENSIKEFPLVNELVIVSQYMGSQYYSRRLNTRNFINTVQIIDMSIGMVKQRELMLITVLI